MSTNDDFGGELPHASFHDGRVVLFPGDCMDVLKALPENSIDAVVTDPPYHLTSIVKRFGAENAAPCKEGKTGAYARASRGFMGKVWDGGDIAFTPELWAEVLRVLKPGGHMACFGGTRTYHRMACAIEDAGFEIRDALQWLYGSGFPKSHNVAIGIDKASGSLIARGKRFNTAGQNVGLNQNQELRSDHPDYAGYSPATEAARQWQGWGTALKPACEIICLARKPLSEGTVAANVLRWGTGAINVDGCRVEGGDPANLKRLGKDYGESSSATFGQVKHAVVGGSTLGRFPANLIHDGSPEVLAGFPNSGSGSGKRTQAKPGAQPFKTERGWNSHSMTRDGATAPDDYGDKGSAARFFYHAKANQNDRISRTIETVTVEWISESGPCQVSLRVDTEPSHERDIAVSGSTASSDWSTFLSGSAITALCQMASKCTIKTATNSITSSPTWNWLTRLLTSAFIQAANCEEANGSSHAENAEKSDPCLIITLGETASLPGASRAKSGTQLKISVNAKKHGHPTVKPIALMAWLVRMITPPGGTVLDPFAGTGTTAAAAFQEGARAVLIEREEEYREDIVRRVEALKIEEPKPIKATKPKAPRPINATELPLFSAGHA